LPTGGAGGGLASALVGLVVGLAETLGFPVFSLLEVLFDVPHAARSNTAAAKVTSQVSRDWSGMAGINVSPIAALARASVYPS
jgi:hypothetical protein